MAFCVMRYCKYVVFIGTILAVFLSRVYAQTNSVNYVTVTNYVTVVVTNYVTITNPPAAAVAQGGSTNSASSTNAVAPVAKAAATPKFPWNSSITAGLTLTRGNSDTLLTTAKFATNKKTPLNEFNLGADAAYGSANDVENVETYHGFGQWNHLFSENWYGYLRAEGLHDGIADVEYRATLTSGIGYYLIKNTNTTFSAEAGPGYIAQRVGEVDDSYATWRMAEKFEHKFNKGSARVWENVEFLPKIGMWSNYLVNSEIGVESALYKSLSLQVFIDDNYNSVPASDRKRNDVKLVSGLSYKF